MIGFNFRAANGVMRGNTELGRKKKLSKKEKSIGARTKTLRSENDSKPAKLVDGKLPSSPAYDVIGGRDPT